MRVYSVLILTFWVTGKYYKDETYYYYYAILKFGVKIKSD